MTQLQKEFGDCLPHGIRDHEKTDAGAGGEPPTAKIYFDPSPEVLGESRIGNSTVRYLKPLCVQMVGTM